MKNMKTHAVTCIAYDNTITCTLACLKLKVCNVTAKKENDQGYNWVQQSEHTTQIMIANNNIALKGVKNIKKVTF